MDRPITWSRLSGVVRWILIIGVVVLALFSVSLAAHRFDAAVERIEQTESRRQADEFRRMQHIRWIGCLLSELQKVGTTTADVRQCDLILPDEDRQVIERVRR